MAKYPTNSEVPRRNPEAVTIRQKTLTSQFDDNGREKRRRKWLYPKRDVSVVHEGLTKAQIATLYDFYMARSGSYEAFSFFLTLSNTYTGEYVGTGDGSTTGFDLPGNETGGWLIYHNAILVESLNYTIYEGGGADGADRIVFTVAPNSGVAITATFTGKLRIRGRFLEDNMTYETFYDRIVNTGLQIRGLLNDE